MNRSNILKLILGAGCAVLLMTSFSSISLANGGGTVIEKVYCDCPNYALESQFQIIGTLTTHANTPGVEKLAICPGNGPQTVVYNPASQ